MELASLIIVISGLSILFGAYFPQLKMIYKHKHTYGMSPIAWAANWVGRVVFAIYGIWAIETTGLVTLIGQGLVGIVSIPIVYYSIRNSKHGGEYIKQHFRWSIFAFRIGMWVSTIGVIIIALLTRPELGSIISVPKSDMTAFVVSLIAGALTGISFAPQTIKVIKSRKTKSISLVLTFMFTLGNTLFIIAMFITAIDKDVWLHYIGAIVFALMSVTLMGITFVIKLQNTIKYKKQNIIEGGL